MKIDTLVVSPECVLLIIKGDGTLRNIYETLNRSTLGRKAFVS